MGLILLLMPQPEIKYGCLLWCFCQNVQVFQQVLAMAIFLIAFAFIITILSIAVK